MVGALLVLAATGAGAATQIGQTVKPDDHSPGPISTSCSQDLTWLQSVSPSNQYAAPADGVITSWSFLGGSIAPSQLKLKVGRVVPITSMTVVGESAFETPAANTLNTFSTRVPVHALDVIGFYFPSPNFTSCAANDQPGYTVVINSSGGEVTSGVTWSPITTTPDVQLDVSALLEPDADHDGFGDETQDQCPTDASTAGVCPPPPPPTDQPAAEALLSYVTPGKLKLKKRIAYRFVCSTECQVTATSTLVLRGPDVGPIVDTGSFPADQIIEVFLRPNRSARRAIRRHIGASKLRTSVTATNPATGLTDTSTRVFRFRR